MDRRHGTIKRRDAVPMWVELRVSEYSGDAFLETLGDEVLQAFSFIVKFIDGVVQYLVEKGLDQPVMTNDLEGTPFPSA